MVLCYPLKNKTSEKLQLTNRIKFSKDEWVMCSKNFTQVPEVVRENRLLPAGFNYIVLIILIKKLIAVGLISDDTNVDFNVFMFI